jgi:XTP/dITP diphosphohydrolase
MDRRLRRLVVATGNPGKLREIDAALDGLEIHLVAVKELAPAFDPEETGETFLDNARIKALDAARATGLPAVADDSGLCVVGLGLEPGVRSARYAGPGKSDRQRIDALLEAMAGLDSGGRRAWFACAVCALLPPEWLSDEARAEARPSPLPDLVEVKTEGRLMGAIGHHPSGDRGFGYDPVFHPDADPTRTLAQFHMSEKNAISHRGQAFAALRKLLRG